MKIKCGDANPNGNVELFFRGGCKEEIKIEESYRCTGCGGFFHLECIFKHFELEKDHDYARNALRELKDKIEKDMNKCQRTERRDLLEIIKKGLDKKLDNKRLKI